MTYWANMQYLDGRWFRRLSGPVGLGGSGLYKDKNMFALLFVTGLPFIYYLGFYFQNIFLRLSCWLIIPFGWHAIFLTGFRGLLGLVVTALMITLKSKKKLIGFVFLIILAIAYIWQGGLTMKERAGTIGDYETKSSAKTRTQAWSAAVNMMKDNPIFGVGVASFGPAFPFYSNDQPRVAHNTFFQIAASWGVIGGAMFLLIIFKILSGLPKNGKY